MTAPAPLPEPTPTLVLASHCTVKDAVALRTQLCAVAGELVPVIVDVGNVQRLDTATLQLLCAFVAERRSKDLGIEWRGSSAAFNEAIKLLSLNAMLGLPDGAPA